MKIKERRVSEVARRCPSCGTSADPTWAYCGVCAAPLTHASPTPGEGAPGGQDRDALRAAPAFRPRRRWRLVAWVVAVLGALLLAAGAGYVQQETQNELDATRSELSETRDALRATEVNLEDTAAQLTGTRGALDQAESQLAQLKGRLDDARRELSGLRGTLSDAEQRLNLQANQIETLKSCLQGVNTALGYAAYLDYQAALAALEAVEVSCQRAYELF